MSSLSAATVQGKILAVTMQAAYTSTYSTCKQCVYTSYARRLPQGVFLPESELMMSMITGDVLNSGHHVVNQLQQGDI